MFETFTLTNLAEIRWTEIPVPPNRAREKGLSEATIDFPFFPETVVVGSSSVSCTVEGAPEIG